MRKLLIVAAILAAAAATPAAASSTQSFKGAEALDKAEVAFARHTREHRMWEIQRNLDMQQRGQGYGHSRGYGERGYRGGGYGDRSYGGDSYGGRSYGGRHYGGPPPHAPAYGRRAHDRYYRY